MTNKTTFPIST